MQFCVRVQQQLHQDLNIYTTSYVMKITHLKHFTYNFRLVMENWLFQNEIFVYYEQTHKLYSH